MKTKMWQIIMLMKVFLTNCEKIVTSIHLLTIYLVAAIYESQITRAGPEIFAKGHPLFLVLSSEFSETPNQADFDANFWFCTHTFPAGDSNLLQFFFCLRVSNSLKTPEDNSGSPNLASATKDQKIAAGFVIVLLQ